MGPDAPDGNWPGLAARLEPLLSDLQSAPAARRLDHAPKIPAVPGLYLFEEHGRPVYVGQTRNLRRRLADHCRPSGGHNKATLAFLIARRAGAHFGSRKSLELSDEFGFADAKRRVAQMQIRYVEERDPALRTVFEVYATLRLKLPYNDFETH
jgi:hypothetical protein